MNTLHRHLYPLTLAIMGALCVPAAQAELVDEAWIVRSGDGLYGIARQLAPKDLRMQARIRSEISQLNPRLDPRTLEIGMSLRLPSFLFENNKPAPAPVVSPARSVEPPAPMQVSKSANTPDPQEIIGRVVIQTGNMTAENRGSSRQLNRAANILKGDTLKTASNARSQIRLKDGALIALSPGTELKFEEFAYNGSEDGSERSIINLVRGGFRTITGAIGHTNKQNYQVRTSVATIGIRGTHYGLMLCEAGSCQNSPELGNLSDGLYGGVVDGSVIANNDAGQFAFNNDQFFHIQSQQMPAIETLLPPPVFQDAPVRPGEKAPADNMVQGPKPLGDTNRHNPYGMLAQNPDFGPMARPLVTNPNLQQGAIGNTALPTPAPSGSGMAVAFSELGSANGGAGTIHIGDGNKNGIFLETIAVNGNIIRNLPFAVHEEHNIVDQDGNVIGREVHDAVRNHPNGSGAVYENLGGNALFGVNWGRWSGNFVLLEDGVPIAHDNNLHFMYSDRLTPKDTLFNLGGIRGRIDTYRVIGGTAPTDNLGNIASGLAGVNISASFDFVAQQMLHYSANISNFSLLSQPNWTGSTAGPVAFTALGDSFQLTNDASSLCTTCTGDANVMFVGNTAGALMSSYAIYDTTFSYALSGTALLAPQNGAVPNGTTVLVAAESAITPTAFTVNVALGSRDNIYTNANGPISAIDHYIGSDSMSHYNSLTVNPSLATATVSNIINDTILTSAGVNAYWGRWDVAATVSVDGNKLPVTTAHIIGSNTLTTPAQLGGLTGSATYSIANIGLAHDANLNGINATSVSVGMTANFINQQITAYSANVSGLLGELDTTTPVPFTDINRGFSLVDSAGCGGSCSPRGTSTVQFIGNQAQGALTSFSLYDGTNTAAGVALLTQ